MNLKILLSQSLKTRVTLFTLAIFVISIWSLAYFASRMLRVDMERLSGEQQFSTVSYIAAEVNRGLEDRIKALELIAHAIDPALLANTVSLQKFLDERYVLHSMFNAGVIALSSEGIAIADFPITTGRAGVNFMDKDYAIGALKEGKATISRPIMGRWQRAPVFVVSVPIRDAQGNVVGALAGVTNLSMPNFLDEIAGGRYGKTGGYLLVAPQYRLVITASDKSRIMENLPAPGINPLMDRFIAGYEGSGILVNPLGVEVLSSAKGIPAAGWYAAVTLPTAEVFAPIHALQRRMLLAAAILTLLAGGLTWWVLSRQLSPMLAAVKMLAMPLDASLPPRPLPIARQDEVGQLIGGVNALLESLAQRESALRESEDRFRTLVDWTPEPFFVHRDGKLIFVNPATVKMFGATSAQDLIGKPFLDRIHPDFHDIVRARVKKMTDIGGNAPMAEMKFLKLDETEIDVEIQGTPIVYDGTLAIHVAVRDITGRKRTEESLEENREKYRGLSEGAFEAIFISEEGQCLEQNRRAEELFGYSAEEAVGRLGTEWIAPEDRDQVMKNMLTGYEAPYEVTGLRKDGSTFPALIHGKMMHFKGRTVRVTSMSDISERKQTEAKLIASETRLRTIIENEPECVKIVDARGLLRQMNPAGLAMIEADSLEQVAGRPVLDVIAPEYRGAFAGLHARVLAGESVKMEFEVLGLKGGRRWLSTIAVPIQDNGETVQLAVTRDITGRKQAEATRALLEAQLRESQKMEAIGTLAGGIAHDFNNILATILGNVELARQDVSANPLALQSLGEIRKAGTRARDLVQQILSFSRRQPTERKLISLAPIIGESERLLRATLPARLSLEVHYGADVPCVQADATLVQQILVNLVTNAMQAMRGGPGHIGIRLDTVLLNAVMADVHPGLRAMHAKYPGYAARIEVSDDGCGMDAATLARIFEPFFTTKAVNEGTGLGLSVAHGIVQTHEGAIEVESQPGKGSTFTIYLPAATFAVGASGSDAPGVPAVPVEDAIATPDNGRGRHILYLDDDESLVFLVQRLLERRGFRVSGFTDQREALATLRAGAAAFDLVVSDYNMPGMSGLDVAREVRAIRAGLPVAIASGYIDEALRAAATGAGVRELIFKANAVEDLCEAFARLAQSVGQESAHG